MFAAGNMGASEMPSTLSSPAVAKNCVAVGKAPSPTNSLHHSAGLTCRNRTKEFGVQVIPTFESLGPVL